MKRNIAPFNGEKYSVWKFRIRALLNEMDVLKVIDQEPPIVLCKDWENSNRIAKSIIVEYLSDSFLCFAKEDSSARQILRSLDAIYERKSLATQLALRKKLLGLKLQGDTALIRHFMIFDDLITELLAAGAKLEETDKVSHLLLTLPNTYDGVITAIETLSEDNLTLSFVKTRLLDHEVKLKNESCDTSKKILQIENKTDSYKRRKFENRKPLNNYYQQNNKFNKRTKTYIEKCHHCGRKGHMKKDCYYFKRLNQQKKTRTVQAVELTPESTSQLNNSSGFAFMMGQHFLGQSVKENELIFLLDSGASDHIINRDDLFIKYNNLQTPVKLSIAKHNEFISATKRGSINVISDMNVQGVLEDVLFCREVPYNLLSVSKIQRAGMTVIFDQGGARILKDGKTIIRGKRMNNLIAIEFRIPNICQSVSQLPNSKHNYELWHQRLGHISKNKFLKLKSNKIVDDIIHIESIIPSDSLCEACINGKQTRLSFNKAKDKNYVNRPLFIVHTDVCGPITPTTLNNKNYFVLFVDQFTHYCVTYLITYKSDVFSVFKDFVAKSEANFNCKLVNLYSDNGREYLSTEMKNYCIEKGITYHLTVPGTPQQNGVSERMVRTITEKARTMLNGAKLDKVFWGDAVLTAVYLINITPTKALKESQTPFELWHNRKPSIKYLKVFGSTVYVHNKTSTSKFDEKSWKGILVGYEPNGYRVWNVECEKYVIVRDVIVDETTFMQTRPVLKPERNNIEYSYNKTDTSKSVSLKSQEPSSSKSDNDKSDVISNSPAKFRKISDDNLTSQLDSNLNQNTDNIVELRRSDRLKNKRPICYDETDNDYLMHAQFLCNIPNSYNEIKSHPDRILWENAIQDEIKSLLINNTWTLVPKPKDKNIIDCKWVFNIKNNEFGKPIRYKARLVARGFNQQYLCDYNETFAPVARIASFRFIVAFANQFNLLIHHLDVKTAFLNGNLNEEVYMKVPEGIVTNNDYVCKLNKALYGLKQAARCWFQVFEQVLKERNFQNSSVDRCIYILNNGTVSKNVYLVLYVDDVVIACGDISILNEIKCYLMKRFQMTDLQQIKLFLGIKVTRHNNIITLDQSSYIKLILNKFNMQDCKPISTPLETKVNYEALQSEDTYNAPCKNLVGNLMYLMLCTRPDLSTCVNILSRYTNKNNKELWKCLKRVLRYLKGTINLKLTYRKSSDYDNILSGYVDSDWGGSDNSDRKSTTGYLFKLFEQCTITWNTKRQASVAASSTEAEYMALYEAVKEALWLKSLATSINLCITKPIVIYEDNSGCISIASNPTNHKRSKHIDIKYHFSREQVERNIIKLYYIPTGQQLADALTKPLPAVAFQQLRSKMGLE